MKRLVVCSFLVFVWSALLVAQPAERQRPEPNYDDLIAYLKLTDSQVACLEANKDAFRSAAAPSIEQLRDLQKQLRQVARQGTDTAAIASQIDSVRASIQGTRATYVTAAQNCVGGASAVSDLVAAEALMKEVRQAIGLLLLQPTEERPRGAWPGRGWGRRGRDRE